MKCCICGCEIHGYGNNPYPLCDEDDYESRCCDKCDGYVIKARIALLTRDQRELQKVVDDIKEIQRN